MRRLVARFFFVFIVGTVAMILGVVTSMTLTPPGRALLARTVSRMLDEIIIGQVKVGAISGSFLYDLTLEDLVVRDTSGALLADLPRVRLNYRLPNFLARQVILSDLQLDHPTIQLIKHRNGRMNYEEVLGLGKGKGGGTSPLIEFHDLKVNGGALRIALPWNPSSSLKTKAQRDSALNAERAKPGRLIEEAPEGLRKVILLSDLTDADVPDANRDTGPQAFHHRPRLAGHTGQRSGGDAPRCRGASPASRGQRGVQLVPRRTTRHPILRRRRSYMAA